VVYKVTIELYFFLEVSGHDPHVLEALCVLLKHSNWV
jgi:hypothetical protein